LRSACSRWQRRPWESPPSIDRIVRPARRTVWSDVAPDPVRGLDEYVVRVIVSWGGPIGPHAEPVPLRIVRGDVFSHDRDAPIEVLPGQSPKRGDEPIRHTPERHGRHGILEHREIGRSRRVGREHCGPGGRHGVRVETEGARGGGGRPGGE